jgi:hypothetical protein
MRRLRSCSLAWIRWAGKAVPGWHFVFDYPTSICGIDPGRRGNHCHSPDASRSKLDCNTAISFIDGLADADPSDCVPGDGRPSRDSITIHGYLVRSQFSHHYRWGFGSVRFDFTVGWRERCVPVNRGEQGLIISSRLFARKLELSLMK